MTTTTTGTITTQDSPVAASGTDTRMHGSLRGMTPFFSVLKELGSHHRLDSGAPETQGRPALSYNIGGDIGIVGGAFTVPPVHSPASRDMMFSKGTQEEIPAWAGEVGEA